MRKKRTVKMALAAGVLATLLSAGGVSSSANLGHVYAIPLSASAGYATRAIVITRGSTSAFHNLDIALHDVISDEGLFSSGLVGVGKSTPINGTASLQPGSHYFHCSLHLNMKGRIIVR